MVLIGRASVPPGAKYAGEINADDLYNDETDKFSKPAYVGCPCCKKRIMPFRSKSVKHRGTSFPWVGLDYQDIVEHYTAVCPKCKGFYEVRVRFEQ